MLSVYILLEVASFFFLKMEKKSPRKLNICPDNKTSDIQFKELLIAADTDHEQLFKN